ncbi:MAG: transglycosylase domain-containing protein [Eubacteriales bacterium]|nr:transglycosylase domain-containing protein [Eubacteriales bacterium]
MKYGRRDIEKKQQNMTAEKLEQKAGMTLARLLVVAIFALVIGIVCAGYGVMRGLISSAPDISSLSTAPAEAATYIYSADGRQLQKLTAPTSNRTPVSLSQVPANLQNAVVAIEDERFYEHNGIDVRGILRAFVVGITGGSFSEGASTITQQLLKNSVFPDWVSESSLLQSFKRKFQEQYLALQLEQTMEKEMSKTEAKQKILEDYLNTINLGAGAYGVQAAAQRYFNKDVSELTLSESAVIAGITQNPTGYNPITYPEANARRRERVLNAMLEQEYITQAEYDEALADDVYSRIQEASAQTGETSVYSYYTDAMIEQILEDLVAEKGYTSNQAYKALYSGGLRIFSVQDEAIQQICDEEFANSANFPVDTLIGLDYALSVQKADGTTVHYSSSDVQNYFEAQDSSFNMMFVDEDTARAYAAQFKAAYTSEDDTILGERISLVPQPQASVVIIEQSTGYVKAIVGGRGTKEASLTLNRATSTRRQPGSTFKPVAVYAPAIDHNNKTLATVYDNAPYSYSSGTELKNWDSDYGYSGLETIHFALVKSVNVVAVKCLTEITPQVGLDYLERFGITTLYDNDWDANGNLLTDAYQPLALGGVTDGVVNLELTGAYAALANGGTYIKPKFYSRIEDSQGNIILDNTSAGTQVVSESTAFLLTKAMEDVVKNPEGTAYNIISLGDMPVAGKTGTTDQSKDIWFEGYTPYYTCGVWGGYDNNDALPDYDRSFSTYAKVLWNSIMTRIHAELPVTQLAQPENIVTATVCKKSGKLAVDGVCTADPRGSQAYTEYFTADTVPTAVCDAHTAVPICTVTGLRASATCPSTTKICIQRPAGSEGVTDDSNYAAPVQTCSGHANTVQIHTEAQSESGASNQTGQTGQAGQNSQTGQTDQTGQNSQTGQTDQTSGQEDGVIQIGGGTNTDNGNTSFDDIPADQYYNDGTIVIYP